MPRFPDVDSDSKVHDGPPAIQKTLQHSDDLSFNIGMAMLEPEDAPASSPLVFLSQAELPDQQDFDPYDPVNLESEHRRVPSPFVSTQPELSQSQASQYSPNESSTDTSSNKLDVIQSAGHSRNDSDPPIYSEYIGDNHQLLNETTSEGQSQSSSSQTSQNPATMTGTGPTKSDTAPPLNSSQNMSSLPSDRNIPRAPTVTRDQDVEVTQHISLAQTSPHILHPRRDGLPSLSVNHGNEPDIQSTHHSMLTYSSSQFQNGRKPPPPRHLPKRLVMPTPLNTGPPLNATASLHIGGVPQGHISSHVGVKQTRFQPSPFNQHSSPRFPLGNLPMTPMHHHENTRAEDVPVSGRKLRKRASMIETPTPAPVITTVSFAPPIIGFHHDAVNGKVIASSKTEKMPKRLLSKRKT